jgi:predicted transport protein
MQYASSRRSTSKKVELTKGRWNCLSRYVAFHYGGSFFELQVHQSVFLLSLMLQNSKGDELEVDVAGNVGRHGGQKMSAERAT